MLHAIDQYKAGHNFNSNGDHWREYFKTSEDARAFSDFNTLFNKQLNDALAYIKTNIIIEEVIKHPDKAKADRFYNYPYDAVEEVLSNAVRVERLITSPLPHKSVRADLPHTVHLRPAMPLACKKLVSLKDKNDKFWVLAMGTSGSPIW